jgi:dihydroxyacetone kinase-like predicted kinase
VVVDGDPAIAAARLIDLLLGSGGELVTVLVGAAAQQPDALVDGLAAHVHRRHPGTEFACYRTGHRGDVLLIGIE